MMRRLLLVIAIAVGAGCSSSGFRASITTSPVALTTAPTPTTVQPMPTAVMPSVVEQIGSSPFDIGPLPPGVMPQLSVAEVVKLIPSGQMASRFFLRPSDLATVKIRVGLITDHSAIDGTASNDPTFVGYVIEGGHSTCTPSGPPLSDGSYPPDAPCHALFILNGDSGREIGGFSEVGD